MEKWRWHRLLTLEAMNSRAIRVAPFEEDDRLTRVCGVLEEDEDATPGTNAFRVLAFSSRACFHWATSPTLCLMIMNMGPPDRTELSGAIHSTVSIN